MGKMKANRKFVNEDEAVSAVIGVILMVAITVAIAATVYVYVSGMLGGGPSKAPDMSFNQDNIDKTLTLVRADANLDWADFTSSYPATITAITLDGTAIGATGLAISSGAVTAGAIFAITGTGTITIRHIGTNTLMGTWTFN
jgi:flagellin-like protein